MFKPKDALIAKADKRIWEIDFLRGVLIIGMVVDHFMFFLGMFGSLYPEGSVPLWLTNVGDFANAYWYNNVKDMVRYLGVSLFFILTGISSKFSRSNLKRSLICTAFGIGLSLVYMTYSLIAKVNHYSLIGVITCLGLGMFFYWLGKTIYVKIHKSEENWKWWALGIGATLFTVSAIINLCISTNLRFGYILLSMFGEYTPGVRGSDQGLTFGQTLLTIIGFFKWGNDWLCLTLFVGLTYIGGFIGEHVYATRKSIFYRKDEAKNKEFNANAIKKTWFINWLGTKTFIIYFIHPIVIIILFFAIFSISCQSLPTFLNF